MENLNPFWWTGLLISAWIGGVGVVITLLAGAVWLVRRSTGSLIVFFVLLALTFLSGVIFVVSAVLGDSRWP
jgi:hypothetical protein